MSNTILTPDMITREALRVLHENLNFVGNIDRQYDSSFAQSGAKIGDSLRIRKPARYTVRSGATLSAQNHTERSTTLQVNNQTGVDVSFSSAELTLSLDDFSKRYIVPAASRIAAEIESKVLQDAVVGTANAVAGATFKDFLTAGAYLDNRAASTAGRSVWAAPLTQVEIIDELKALQNDEKQISQQYLEGKMGVGAGFKWYSNSKLPTIAIPADIAGAVNATVAVQGATEIVVKALGTGTIPAGTAFTVANVYAVNYETGATLPYLRQFIVTEEATITSNVATLKVSEPMYTTGALKSISAFPAEDAVVSIIGGTAGTTKQINLACAEQFMTFATADLVLPGGVDMAARETLDGISMRLVRQYTISDDQMPCRLEVLWGAKVMQPELGVSVIG